MISIYSTYSQDTISKNDKKITRPGGPLLFIENTLKDLRVSYKSFFGKTINVEIKVQKGGEVGRITTTPKVQIVPNTSPSNFVIVSTIFHEWDMSKLNKPRNNFFIDIQGYVRDAKKMGKKKLWKDIEKYSNNFYCLKGTAEEMLYLPRNVFEEQKKRFLIITNGREDVIYYFRGKEYSKPTSRIMRPNETIGAGDTFFGYLVGYLSRGATVHQAIANANIKTSEFICHKKNAKVILVKKDSKYNVTT